MRGVATFLLLAAFVVVAWIMLAMAGHPEAVWLLNDVLGFEL